MSLDLADLYRTELLLIDVNLPVGGVEEAKGRNRSPASGVTEMRGFADATTERSRLQQLCSVAPPYNAHRTLVPIYI
jgi:hypothetical protein